MPILGFKPLMDLLPLSKIELPYMNLSAVFFRVKVVSFRKLFCYYTFGDVQKYNFVDLCPLTVLGTTYDFGSLSDDSLFKLRFSKDFRISC